MVDAVFCFLSLGSSERMGSFPPPPPCHERNGSNRQPVIVEGYVPLFSLLNEFDAMRLFPTDLWKAFSLPKIYSYRLFGVAHRLPLSSVDVSHRHRLSFFSRRLSDLLAPPFFHKEIMLVSFRNSMENIPPLLLFFPNSHGDKRPFLRRFKLFFFLSFPLRFWWEHAVGEAGSHPRPLSSPLPK